jgi:hypothetical protein
MNANGAGDTKWSKGFSVLLVIQLLIAAATVAVMIVVGQKIEPLIKERNDLRTEIAALEKRRNHYLITLDSLSVKIAESLREIEESKIENPQIYSARQGLTQAQTIAAVSDTAEAPARVYIHIRGEFQRGPASRVGDSLKAAGFIVPGIERLVEKGPRDTELRFFRNAEEKKATRITGLLEKMGIKATLSDLSATYENSQAIRPGHYELWFGPGEFEQQQKQ